MFPCFFKDEQDQLDTSDSNLKSPRQRRWERVSFCYTSILV